MYNNNIIYMILWIIYDIDVHRVYVYMCVCVCVFMIQKYT